jgi:hypothetical protein
MKEQDETGIVSPQLSPLNMQVDSMGYKRRNGSERDTRRTVANSPTME